jgi:hypothetical protein
MCVCSPRGHAILSNLQGPSLFSPEEKLITGRPVIVKQLEFRKLFRVHHQDAKNAK